jgi:hypothetical protein
VSADPAPVAASAWQVRGHPTTAELAAVVAVLSAAAASPSGAPAPAGGTADGGWSAYWRSLRPSVDPGPGAWRASGWPR